MTSPAATLSQCSVPGGCHFPERCMKEGPACNTRSATRQSDECSARHTHEPEIPPVLAEDGHCRVCRLIYEADQKFNPSTRYPAVESATERKDEMDKAPKPKAKGYSAAYRMLLEQEFLGDDGKAARNRAPTVLRAAISEMLCEIENLRAASTTTKGELMDIPKLAVDLAKRMEERPLSATRPMNDTPSNEVLLRTMNALERLAFLRRKMPSHGTHAEEMVNAFQTVQAALDAATKSPLSASARDQAQHDAEKRLAAIEECRAAVFHRFRKATQHHLVRSVLEVLDGLKTDTTDRTVP